MMQKIIIFITTMVALYIIYNVTSSADFEKIPPDIKISVMKPKSIIEKELNFNFYNPENIIKINAQDSSGIRKYEIKIVDSKNNVLSSVNEIVLKKINEIDINLPLIKTQIDDGDKIKLIVQIRDWSNANLFRGNEAKIEQDLSISKKSPHPKLISFSEKIVRGGSAMVAFDIQGDKSNIDKIIISNGINSFKTYEYKNINGKNIYLSLMAWPVENTFFEGSIKIIDKALNESSTKININRQINIISRKINVRLSENSLNNVLENIGKNTIIPKNITDPIDKFKFINETLRNKDDKKIKNKFINNNSTTSERLTIFRPLENASINDRFNNETTYFLQKEKIGIHKSVGMTLTSKNPSVYANDANIIYTGQLNTYGNIAILSYPLGLNAVYGNLSQIDKKDGHVKNGQFASIGKSGFLFKNRLFFAILINGNFVDPNEWLSQSWFNKNIQHILDIADKY